MADRREPVLGVDALHIRAGGRVLLEPLSLALRAGECHGLVGESGSGKSLTALSLLSLLPPGLRAGGVLRIDGGEFAIGSEAHARLRGDTIAWIPQDPLAALHPLRSIGSQLGETLRAAGGFGRAAAAARAAELLARVQLPDPGSLLQRYPHQLSGGQRQRVLIALALATRPRVLVADEPTSALDPRLAREVLELLDGLRREEGLALLLISHDLPLVGAYAQRVTVLRRGAVVESGETAALFAAPRADYTRELLAAGALPPSPPSTPGQPLLQADSLRLRYPRAMRDALDGVEVELRRGECLAVVGESGSGKSSLARALLRLHRRGLSGALRIDGIDWLSSGERTLRPQRRRIGFVQQDPFASLDPRLRIGQIVTEPLRIHGLGDAAARRAMAASLLADVGLEATLLERYPHQCSGGQCQRVSIARALATDPGLLVCDEAISALDAHHRAGILTLLGRLKAERGLALLFITHDLAAARALGDRIAVMLDGRIVETGAVEAVLAAPRHRHTRALLQARPAPPASAVEAVDLDQ